MDTIGAIIKQILLDKKERGITDGTFRGVRYTCCLCEEEYDTWAITYDGVNISPDICPKCSDMVYDEIRTCPNCRKEMPEFAYKVGDSWSQFRACPNCSDNSDLIREHIQRQRLLEWERICPEDFRVLNPDLLPVSGRDLYDFSREWKKQKSGRGLLFIGPSGSGKTRCMYAIARRLFLRGVPIKIFPLGEFPVTVSTLFSSLSTNPRIVDEWLKDLMRYSVIFIDDLGKGIITDRVASVLLEVIDKFGSHKKTMLFTTNNNGRIDGESSNSIVSKMGDRETGIAIVRRIREYCDIVSTDTNRGENV